MATVSEWVDLIRLDCPEPLDSTIARQVVQAIQRFFKETEAWKLKEVIPVVSGTTEYYLGLPSNTYVLMNDYAYHTAQDDTRTKIVTTLPERMEIQAGNPQYISHTRDSVLLDGSAGGGTLLVGVKLQPMQSITEIPDEYADSWFTDIQNGAMALLLRIPDKSWTNTESSVMYESMFRESIASVKREARKDRSRPKRAVRFNTGFAW